MLAFSLLIGSPHVCSIQHHLCEVHGFVWWEWFFPASYIFLGSLPGEIWGLTLKETRHKYLKAVEEKCIQLKENTVTARSLSDGRRLTNTLSASANVISLIRFAQRVACWLTWRWTMSHWLMLLLFDPFCLYLLPASERLERALRNDRCMGWCGRRVQSWI